MSQSISFWFENLAVTGDGERLPLSALSDDAHIHGGLRLQIGGRLVPHLGYFGADDVCFDTWLDELQSVAAAFESANEARYIFDEGEQGQPAFVFERLGEMAYFSIVDSEISDGATDPAWQRIEFSPLEFLAEYDRFRASLFATVLEAAPATAEGWIRGHDSGSRFQ